jgi:hypothetical protein
MARGLRDLLPLIVGIIIVAILLTSWIRSAAKQIGSSAPPAGVGMAAPPIAARPVVAATPDARLGWLAKAILMYVADYDMTLPPLSSTTQLQPVLMPYVAREPRIFIDPASGALFGVNTSLSYKSMKRIRNPADIVIFYQTQPEPGTNKRWVAFLDGRVEQVDPKRWQQLSRTSGITQPSGKKRTRKP